MLEPGPLSGIAGGRLLVGLLVLGGSRSGESGVLLSESGVERERIGGDLGLYWPGDLTGHEARLTNRV